MPKLVKLDTCENNPWTLVDQASTAERASEYSLLPVEAYVEYASHTDAKNNIGVWLRSDDDVHQLQPHLDNLPVIACDFSAFADGRSFSQARILRDELEYQGEIIAHGNFIQDQVFYLQRCGFSAFAVEDNTDIASLQESLKDFSESYQAASDVAQPLFRRRA